jgi:hypothetical protein
MLGAEPDEKQSVFSLACAVSSNQGREDIVPVIIEGEQVYPIIGKSGLITTLAVRMVISALPEIGKG